MPGPAAIADCRVRAQESGRIGRREVLWGNTQQGRALTDDPEDAQDVGGEDDQEVDTGEQADGDERVPQPAELPALKHHLLDGTAHLGGRPAVSAIGPPPPAGLAPRPLPTGSPETERWAP